MPALDRVLSCLRDPRSYPHRVDRVEECETHISLVFLAGDFAYKLKKPVTLGFLDYGTVSERRRYAHAELDLNRRLAPTIYLGLAAVREVDGEPRLSLDDDGSTRQGVSEGEPLVRMRRVAPEASLEAMLADGRADAEHIDLVVERLAAFYRGLAPIAAGPDADVGRVREVIGGNFDVIAAEPQLFPRGRVAAVRSAQLGFVELRSSVLLDRREEGWIRDGHGDLRPEHVIFLPECAIMDCVEFRDAFRKVDVASDIAFLVMELEFRGASAFAARLRERLGPALGGAGFDAVLPLYASYRACVRAKVSAIRCRQAGVSPEARADLERRARRYLELAAYFALELGPPLVIGVGGISGSGKSTLALRLGEKLGMDVLRSDEIRKELAGIAPTDHAAAARRGDLYDVASTARTYEELARRARSLVESGAGVIVDATFGDARHREALRRMARETGARFAHVECRVERALAHERVRRRAEHGGDASDATASVVDAQIASWEPPGPGEAIVIDGSPPPERVTAETVLALARTVAP